MENLKPEPEKSRATLSKNERGATMVEYSLLVTLMSIMCIASVEYMKEGVRYKFEHAADVLGDSSILGSSGGGTIID